MWTYTCYILKKYLEKFPKEAEGLRFNEFADFIFDNLWRQHKMAFHDGKDDLLLDLIYLENLKILKLEGVKSLEGASISIIDKKRLEVMV